MKVNNTSLVDTLAYFGINSSMIDNNGYYSFYIIKDELVKIEESLDLYYNLYSAQFAANNNTIYEFKAKPSDVNFDIDNMKVTYDKGGFLRNGYACPNWVERVKNIDEMRNSNFIYSLINDSIFETIYNRLTLLLETNTPEETFESIKLDILRMIAEEDNSYELYGYDDFDSFRSDIIKLPETLHPNYLFITK